MEVDTQVVNDDIRLGVQHVLRTIIWVVFVDIVGSRLFAAHPVSFFWLTTLIPLVYSTAADFQLINVVSHAKLCWLLWKVAFGLHSLWLEGGIDLFRSDKMGLREVGVSWDTLFTFRCIFFSNHLLLVLYAFWSLGLSWLPIDMARTTRHFLVDLARNGSVGACAPLY